jgi:glycosyltransferase involved in cell wall biosynthesis
VAESISLLIPTMNNPWHLDITISSAVKHAQTAELDILVYSNEHQEHTDALIKVQQDAGWPVRVVERTPENHGVARAVNAMAEVARGDFYMYPADDVYFMPGWDTALLRRIRPKDWQYLTPRMMEPEGSNPTMYAPHNFGKDRASFNEQKLHRFWNSLYKQDVVSCAGPPFVASWIWEAVGGFDETFWPGFGTDPDFSHSVYSMALDRGQNPEFLAVGDCGCYHFQCITTKRVSTVPRRQEAHRIFENKWKKTTREFGALIGDGIPV